MGWSLRLGVLGQLAPVVSLCCVSLSLAACRQDHGTQSHPSVPDDGAQKLGREWFVDATAQTGLDFVHVNGMTGQFYYPEIIAPGVALFDYDNDGDLDVFLVQGGSIDRAPGVKTIVESRGGRLFRNDLEVRPGGTRIVRFTDVTEASGIRATEYGMGVAVGDDNNDGCVDLYVTALGKSQLFRNQCDGTFTEVAATAGVNDSGWSVSAAFVDFDRDGWLDLYVGHYLNWEPSLSTPCFGQSGKRVYCAPRVYVPQQSRLYHNDRDGTFTDVTVASGIGAQFGPALGVTTADFNGDGWIDLYIANDGQENQLWINQRNGTFKDVGLISGAALSELGQAKAGMGVDAGDFDDDGDEDVFVTNLSGEGHDLYVNDGSGAFENRSAASGLIYQSLPFTGFGSAWLDVDNDGRVDILTVNGTVQRIDAMARAGDPHPLRQRKQLFHSLGNGRFEDLTDGAGAVFQHLDVGRGAAFGDIDNDGDTDVIIGNNNGPAQVLFNAVGNRNHWIGLRLAGRAGLAGQVGSKGGVRDVLGARAAIIRQGQPTRWRRARADGSFASANDARVLVGLGASGELPRVRVTWPDGQVEEWQSVPIDRYSTLLEGSSK
jgi:enediyne biosynthesis protein E4